MDSIKDLQPNIVWKNFYSLTQIPRPSKHEEKVVAFIKKFGEDLGLETIVDEIGNVIIRKPATPGIRKPQMRHPTIAYRHGSTKKFRQGS